jgi:hypothetical protein
MHITFVKKILADGNACAKCADVEQRLTDAGQLGAIDETLVADERNPASAGMQLAKQLGIERAPFFVVEQNGETTVYTVYFKFVKEVLGRSTSTLEENREILRDNPELDFL